MSRDALKTFVALEIRRGIPMLRRSTMLVATMAVGMAVLGWATASRMAWLLGFLAVNYGMVMPGHGFRDKLDGTTEFMVTLPVPMSLLARSRMIACALASAPAAFVTTVALFLGLPSVGIHLKGLKVTVGLGLGLWLVATTATCLGLAMITRISIESLNYVFLGSLAALWGGDNLLERMVPDPVGTVMGLVEQSWFVAALGTGMVFVSVALLGASHYMLRTGLERFRPRRDAITI